MNHLQGRCQRLQRPSTAAAAFRAITSKVIQESYFLNCPHPLLRKATDFAAAFSSAAPAAFLGRFQLVTVQMKA